MEFVVPLLLASCLFGAQKNLAKGNLNDSNFGEGNSCYPSMNPTNHGVIFSSWQTLYT